MNYRRQLGSASCPFCEPQDPSDVIETTPHFYVRKNKFPYDVWEMRSVVEHLMVIPKRHVKNYAELTLIEQAELMTVLATYQSTGYDVYARSDSSTQLTVPNHQHSHLIKTNPKRGVFSLILKKPYLLIKL